MVSTYSTMKLLAFFVAIVTAAPSPTSTASAPTYTYQPVHFISGQSEHSFAKHKLQTLIGLHVDSNLCLGVETANKGAVLSARPCGDGTEADDLTVFTSAPYYAPDVFALDGGEFCISATTRFAQGVLQLAACDNTNTAQIWEVAVGVNDTGILKTPEDECITLGRDVEGAPVRVKFGI